ncbi:transaldolase family protein [Streptomyces griseoviridis]
MISSDVLDHLGAEGVSLWLEDYHRGRLATLHRLVAAGLTGGVICRPTAVTHALPTIAAYQEQLARLRRACASADERVCALIADDARSACTVLEPAFRTTKGLQGWVSLGVPPLPGADAATLADRSRQLARMVGRPNLLIRIPGGSTGLAAAGELLAHGIGTHLCVSSVNRYDAAVDACFLGLERAAARGRADLAHSVISLDVSGLDTAVDALLDVAGPAATGLRGQAGQALARLLYHRYEQSLGSPRWRSLVISGARPQRLLWMSGGTPESPRATLDQVGRLIAWMTSHALSQPALDALDNHDGFTGDTLTGQRHAALRARDDLKRAGVDLDLVERKLEATAGERDQDAWTGLLTAVRRY